MSTKAAVKKKKNNSAMRTAKTLLIILIVLLVALIAVFGYCAYEVYRTDAIYSGVTSMSVDLSGMTRKQAAQALSEQANNALSEMEFTVTVRDAVYTITAADVEAAYDIDAAATAAIRYGRSGSFLENVNDVMKARSIGYEVEGAMRYSDARLQELAGRIASEQAAEAEDASYQIFDDRVEIHLGAAGCYVDEALLYQQMKENIDSAAYADLSVETDIMSAEDIDLQAIADEVYRPAVDAVAAEDGKSVIPEQAGIELNLTRAKEILAKGGTDFTIPLTVLAPAVTEEILRPQLCLDVLATYTTTLDPGKINRTANIKLACDFINGTLLQPGDEFSFNKVVGERTYERGFKDAAIYLAGEIADGVGGGICQVSSTIYNAAVYANLEITERKNHRYTVTYTDLGMDATVSYPSKIDFRFRNSTDYPMRIEAIQEADYVTVTLYGTKVGNQEVKVETKTLSRTEFGTVYQADENIAIGKSKTKNAGYTGVKTESYRVVYEDGKEVSRTLENRSTYTKLDKVILRNPADLTTDENGNLILKPADAPGTTTGGTGNTGSGTAGSGDSGTTGGDAGTSTGGDEIVLVDIPS